MNTRRNALTLVELLVAIAVIGVLMAILLPALQWSRERARETQCLSSLRQQSLAALSFEQRMGHLPGVDIRPLFVEFSPDYEQRALYERFEPWTPLITNPNLTLGKTGLTLLRCPTAGNGPIAPYSWAQTDFTLSARVEGMDLARCIDGTTSTMMFFEFADIELCWIEAAPLPPNIADVRRSRHSTFHLVTCGGNTLAISKAIDADIFQALLTPNGGEVVSY